MCRVQDPAATRDCLGMAVAVPRPDRPPSQPGSWQLWWVNLLVLPSSWSSIYYSLAIWPWNIPSSSTSYYCQKACGRRRYSRQRGYISLIYTKKTLSEVEELVWTPSSHLGVDALAKRALTWLRRIVSIWLEPPWISVGLFQVCWDSVDVIIFTIITLLTPDLVDAWETPKPAQHRDEMLIIHSLEMCFRMSWVNKSRDVFYKLFISPSTTHLPSTLSTYHTPSNLSSRNCKIQQISLILLYSLSKILLVDLTTYLSTLRCYTSSFAQSYV